MEKERTDKQKSRKCCVIKLAHAAIKGGFKTPKNTSREKGY
jgi:hypothetical protein